MKTYPNVIQKSEEWDKLRLGIPTASAFEKIVTPSGGRSQSHDKYMHKLIAERIQKQSMDKYKSWEMEQGSAMEGEAHDYFSLLTDLVAVNVGFVSNDAGTIGASPDSFVGDKQTLEIKCPTPPEHVGHLLHHGSIYKDHVIQVQGQLWICEREEAWVLSYCPGFPHALEKVGRDDKLITVLEKGVTAFSQQLEAAYADLIAKGLISGASARADGVSKGRASQAPDLSEIMRQSLIEVQK